MTIRMGNCNHRRCIPALRERVRRGEIDPTEISTQSKPLDSAIEAYEALDTHAEGWIKVELEPTDPDVGFH